MAKRFEHQFTLPDERPGMWIPDHPEGKRAPCFYGDSVPASAKRAWIEDLRGTTTYKSKRTIRRIYLCVGHAMILGAPNPYVNEQGELF